MLAHGLNIYPARLVCVTLVLAFAWAGTAVSEEALVAPVYPGAVSFEKKDGIKSLSYFLTPDPHEKVEAFYISGKHARKARDGEGSVKSPNLTMLIVHDYGSTLSILKSRKADFTLARATEVRIEWMPEALRQISMMFRMLYMTELSAGKDTAMLAEAKALREKYGWAELAYYKDGEDARIEKECRDGGLKPLKPRERFDHNKACVERLAKAAYLTLLSLDRDPKTWK